MSYSRTVFAAVVALCVALPSPAAATPAPSVIELSASGQRALKQSSLTLASSPRSPKKTTLSIAPGKATIGASATVELTAALRFGAGKRKVDAKALRLTVGRTSSSISATLGRKRLKLLTVTPTRPVELDAAAGRLVVTRAKVALTPAAAKALRSTLKLKRTPSTASLGTLSLAIVPELAVVPAPTPAPAPIAVPAPGPTATPSATATPAPTETAVPTPTATPTVTATPTPDPALPCGPQRFAATPASSVDWFGCDLAGSGDLKSWTNYLEMGFPPLPGCQATGGSITASGATRIDASAAYDHRFPVTSATVRGDGSATIVTSGAITYRMPAHGIEESIGSFRIEIAPGGLAGTVYADGSSKARDMSGDSCGTAPTPYSAQPVLTLDLAGITPVTADGVQRWIHVPAKIAAGHSLIGGGTYAAGASWGSFTIVVPVR